MMGCFVAVLTNEQLSGLYQMTLSQMHARNMIAKTPAAPAPAPVKAEGWKKVSSKVKTPPTKEQRVAAQKAKINSSAGPIWSDADRTMYYRCCGKETCVGKLFVSYKDAITTDVDDDEDFVYEDKTFGEIYKTTDNTGLFVHGLLGSSDFQVGRNEVLHALKGVVPKSTRVKPGDEFGFIHFDNHAKAVVAQQNLIEAGYKANFLRRDDKK